MSSPLGRLQRVTYWVIEGAIYEYINSNVWGEWEADVRDAGSAAERDWRLQIVS